MKRIAIIVAVSMVAAGLFPVQAQTNTSRIEVLEAGYSSIQSSVDSLSAVISDLNEALEEKASVIEDLDNRIDEQQQDRPKSKVYEVKKYSEIVMKWFCLLIFAIFLPLVLARLYIGKAKEDQRRYDIIVDLIRSGVEIKPELRDYLTGSSSASRGTLRGGVFSGFSKSEIDYCSKRILWAVCLLVIGFTIAMISQVGIVFGIFACIAVIFAAQAAVRYFSLKYFNEHKEKENSTDAE